MTGERTRSHVCWSHEVTLRDGTLYVKMPRFSKVGSSFVRAVAYH